ncbi:GTP-binding protein [Paenibacillus sp. TRM 82003]|nr:GTP-binding protein [Paenibacillus sp. TRM 82003]
MKIPVIILTGFLGSGKTTLLKRLLSDARERSLTTAVLMNELGGSDVDGQILNEFLPGKQLETLTDGCICCSKKSEISGSLSNLLSRSPDVIFIELTGVANPDEIADALTEPKIIDRVYLHSIVTVVDADFFLEYNSILNPDKQLKHTLRRQIETADFILVNKIDLVKAATLVKVEKAVRELNHTAPIRPTKQSEVAAGLLLKTIEPLAKDSEAAADPVNVTIGKSPMKPFNMIKPPAANRSDIDPYYSFSKIKTISIPIRSDMPLSSKELKQTSKSWKKGLLRAKGYIPVDGKLRLVQFVNRNLSIEPTNETVHPYFVLIGFEQEVLETKAIVESWLAAVEKQ